MPPGIGYSQKEMDYVDSLSLDQLQNPRFADSRNQLVQSRISDLISGLPTNQLNSVQANDRFNEQNNRPIDYSTPQNSVEAIAASIAENQRSPVYSTPQTSDEAITALNLGGAADSFARAKAGKAAVSSNDMNAGRTTLTDDKYLNSLGINSIDRFNSLADAGAFSRDNSEAQNILAQLQQRSAPQFDNDALAKAAGQNLSYSDLGGNQFTDALNASAAQIPFDSVGYDPSKDFAAGPVAVNKNDPRYYDPSSLSLNDILKR